MKLRLGTRASTLARTQSGLVVTQLSEVASSHGIDLDVQLVEVTTEGDTTAGPIQAAGREGVFVAALRVALMSGECDLVVHSFKDVPVEDAPDLLIAAVPQRADARDALCSTKGTLAGLPAGARVGTGSPRRRAEVLAARPDLVVDHIRGNVDTRLDKLKAGEFDAIVLALAGLDRLGRTDEVTEVLDEDTMVPAPAQGALAIEIRADAGDELAELVGGLDDPDTRAAVTAERAALDVLEAGCHAPVGAYAQVSGGRIDLHVRVLSLDGSLVLNDESVGPVENAALLGELAGRTLLGRGAAQLVSSGP